jgi:hypothetical protein
MALVYHALSLNMHQPLGDLLALHNSDERWEARQDLWCYDRPPRPISSIHRPSKAILDIHPSLL